MQIILRDDVEHLGHRGDVVNVREGYGRNYLLPRGLAVRITDSNLKQVEHEKRVLTVKGKKEVGVAQDLKTRIEAIELKFERKVGETETLYGSVTNADIADGLAHKGVHVDKRKIVLTEPLKELGTFAVPIKLHREVVAEVKVHVAREPA